nr:MAG TPA: hypothetical protein [Caudoviricetes sp.]
MYRIQEIPRFSHASEGPRKGTGFRSPEGVSRSRWLVSSDERETTFSIRPKRCATGMCSQRGGEIKV